MRDPMRPMLAIAPWLLMAILSGCATPDPATQSSSASQGAPIRFRCSDGSVVVARYSQPDTRTLWLRRADGVAELKSQPAASGARYDGANVSFWEHQGEVTLRWGPNAAPLTCQRIAG